jgi:hypothetical protein
MRATQGENGPADNGWTKSDYAHVDGVHVMKARIEWIWAACITSCVACASAGEGASGKPAPVPPGTVQGGVGGLDPKVQAFALQLKSDLGDAQKTTAAQLQERYSLPLTDGIDYGASTAENLELLQASSMKLEPKELDVLNKQGFVISGRQSFPTFAYGYAAIYASDLPVYISADSIADALHRSYDQILSTLETRLLREELDTLLADLQATLRDQPSSQTRADLDTYLAVAQGLLSGTPIVVAGGSQKTVDQIVQMAVAATGTAGFELFGVKRSEDMSQYKPRGHYEDDPSLQTYFRAMMWLGRVDFRLVETQDDGTQVLHRPQVDAMLMLQSLFTDTNMRRFERIDDVVRAFVGESDNMTMSQVPALLQVLGAKDAVGVAKIDDATLMAAILENGFGKQQIMSALMTGGLDAAVPLNMSFLLFGQRYVVDSHVLSNVVWDRVRTMRMMPDPLDVAFAALGNDQAASLLKDQLEQYDYAGDLAAMRTLVDAHDQGFWHKNLYNDWLSALRALSPLNTNISDPAAAHLPSVTATDAWGRRILNTQLASWAQLRHDTLLYAKQSYSGIAGCHFPDAALDPYPEFYAAVARFADHGYVLAMLVDGAAANVVGEQRTSELRALSAQLRDYFGRMLDVAGTLKTLAESELAGGELTADQLAFINDAVVVKQESAGCVSVDVASGWYTRLFFDANKVLTFDPTVADVHTQPTDEGGNDVGRILHVATAGPRLMVVTDDACGKPKAYVGLASSYYERVTEGWRRMADSEWEQELREKGTPADVKWMQGVVPLPK